MTMDSTSGVWDKSIPFTWCTIPSLPKTEPHTTYETYECNISEWGERTKYASGGGDLCLCARAITPFPLLYVACYVGESLEFSTFVYPSTTCQSFSITFSYLWVTLCRVLSALSCPIPCTRNSLPWTSHLGAEVSSIAWRVQLCGRAILEVMQILWVGARVEGCDIYYRHMTQCSV